MCLGRQQVMAHMLGPSTYVQDLEEVHGFCPAPLSIIKILGNEQQWKISLSISVLLSAALSN